MDDKFNWECTCDACPEQYDIWYNNKLVAYFRLRWGSICVRPYSNGDIDRDHIIFTEDYGDSYTGMFSGTDFNIYKDKIESAIIKYFQDK
jgi:hypothetical protein